MHQLYAAAKSMFRNPVSSIHEIIPAVRTLEEARRLSGGVKIALPCDSSFNVRERNVTVPNGTCVYSLAARSRGALIR